MEKTAFTIVAKNYIGLAKILKKSILEHNVGLDFIIFVADEYDGDEAGVIEAKSVLEISGEQWTQMSFKYDITEFCTSIKPFCFSYLFNHLGYRTALYFDPDIFVFHSLDNVFAALEDKTFYLTPHLVTPENKLNDDKVCLQSGIFNLGFIGISSTPSAQSFLKWWESRLIRWCYDDLISYTFTDQKWANFIPAFFPSGVFISTSLGMNLAPWNYFERQVYQQDRRFFVKNRVTNTGDECPLIFAHYSGFNYKELLSGQISRNRTRKVVVYEDVATILDYYKEQLSANIDGFKKYIDLSYSYGSYDNGERIDKIHRRIYRQMIENGKTFENPFSSTGGFYEMILKRKMISAENVNYLSRETGSSFGAKSKLLCRIMSFIYKVLGYKRYLQLLKFMKYASRMESQAFLLDFPMYKHVLPK